MIMPEEYDNRYPWKHFYSTEVVDKIISDPHFNLGMFVTRGYGSLHDALCKIHKLSTRPKQPTTKTD